MSVVRYETRFRGNYLRFNGASVFCDNPGCESISNIFHNQSVANEIHKMTYEEDGMRWTGLGQVDEEGVHEFHLCDECSHMNLYELMEARKDLSPEDEEQWAKDVAEMYAKECI